MGASLNTDDGFSELNLTPLIDIVLVVLIIMMVNIPIQIEELEVKVPGPKPKDPPPPPTEDVEQLVVAIYEDGTFALNRRAMTEDVLFYEITRRLRNMSKKQVFIDAAVETQYQNVINLIDVAREAGADKVGLSRLKPSGPLAPTSVAPGAMPKGVVIGNPVVVGAFDAAKADAAIQPLKGALMGCYNQLLAKDPEATGRAQIRASIGPDGAFYPDAPTIQNVSDTVEDEAFVQCLTTAAEQLKFPALGDQKTAVTVYPLLFSPG